MNDKKFLQYLERNSVLRSNGVAKYEFKIGRLRPVYCELHDRMVLYPKSTNEYPVADHNHKTGAYRGWICRTCNMQLLPEIDRLRNLGIESDDIKAFLRLLVDYVFSDGKNLSKRK